MTQIYLVYILLMIWPFHGVKKKSRLGSRLRVHETPILEVIFVALTENACVIINNRKDIGNNDTNRNNQKDRLPCVIWY